MVPKKVPGTMIAPEEASLPNKFCLPIAQLTLESSLAALLIPKPRNLGLNLIPNLLNMLFIPTPAT